MVAIGVFYKIKLENRRVKGKFNGIKILLSSNVEFLKNWLGFLVFEILEFFGEKASSHTHSALKFSATDAAVPEYYRRFHQN
jgi:hypothetical protein